MCGKEFGRLQRATSQEFLVELFPLQSRNVVQNSSSGACLVFLFVQGVNLTLKPGAKVALVGPSGGGKVWYQFQSQNVFESFWQPWSMRLYSAFSQ